MTLPASRWNLIRTGFFCAALAAGAWGQTPVSMLVTVQPNKGSVAPAVPSTDVLVNLGRTRVPVTAWQRLADDATGVQLYIALDDDTAQFGHRIIDVRDFITALPPSVAVAVGYLREGTVQTAKTFTQDHAAAAAAVRLPIGTPGISPSPYDSVQQLIKQWPAPPPGEAPAREVILITDGIEHIGGNDTENQILALADGMAQANGIIFYAIYAGLNPAISSDPMMIQIGQSNLGSLTEDSGGEAYTEGDTMPINLTPVLDQIQNRIQNQYWLSFTVPAKTKRGLQPVKVQLETPNAKAIHAKAVYVR